VQQKALELESQNNRLTTSLQSMQQDFKDLLIEVERLRQQVSERDSHIKIMNSEMQALPSL
jgi:peptidoglycan hydrolase CwlO-like protein